MAFGAAVTGVCSAQHADLVRSLGASDVIDYRDGDLGEGARRFDLVLDIGGRTPIRRLRRALTPTGTLVIVGGEGDKWIGGIQRQLWAGTLSILVPQKLKAFVVKEHRDELLGINKLVADHDLTPNLGASFPLQRGVEAIRVFESGMHGARVVIVP